MRTHRIMAPAVAASAAMLVMAGPAAAAATGPLLSGYGGPGEGSQVILGAALVNGPSGGAGAGGSGSGETGGSGEADSPAGARNLAGTGGGSASAQTLRGSSAGAPSQVRRRAPSVAAAGVAGSQLYPSGGNAASVGSQPLGVSGPDLLYVILALAALVLTALLTRQLARRPEDGGGRPG
jgi:hypothetical protein